MSEQVVERVIEVLREILDEMRSIPDKLGYFDVKGSLVERTEGVLNCLIEYTETDDDNKLQEARVSMDQIGKDIHGLVTEKYDESNLASWLPVMAKVMACADTLSKDSYEAAERR